MTWSSPIPSSAPPLPLPLPLILAAFLISCSVYSFFLSCSSSRFFFFYTLFFELNFLQLSLYVICCLVSPVILYLELHKAITWPVLGHKGKPASSAFQVLFALSLRVNQGCITSTVQHFTLANCKCSGFLRSFWVMLFK